MRWRYAAKKFDPTRQIPAETWAALEESLRLTPSSYGLQPWMFVILTSKDLREALVPLCWRQRQVADCSHLVIFAARTNLAPVDVDRFVRATAETRGVEPEKLSGLRRMILSDVVEGDRSEILTEWAVRQTYIALGNFMTSAAMVGVDTCPMEGFQSAEVDAFLGLPDRGLTAALLCPAGYRAADDGYAAAPKVRYPREEVFDYR